MKPTKPVQGGAKPLAPLLFGLAVLSLMSGFLFGSVAAKPAPQPVAIAQEPGRAADRWNQARSAVFKVTVQSVFGVSGGTGYLIRSETYGVVVLTNKHICNIETRDGVFTLEQADRLYYTKIRRKATKTDLCILEPPEEFLATSKGLSLAPRGHLTAPGEGLYVYGHPGLRRLTYSAGIFINYLWAPVQGDEVIEADKLHIGRADIQIYPGSSGSPVMNDAGEVVGTIFAYEVASQMGLFIPLSDMNEFLDGGL